MPSSNHKNYHKALTIAGSDSGGGAGIQADLKTFSALGCYGMSVITAVTAQNSRGIDAVHPVPKENIAEQLDAIFNDMGSDAVKIGMLYSEDAIVTAVKKLKQYNAKNIVLDPILAAQSGTLLLHPQAMAAMTSLLMPLCRLITPNLPEAEALLGHAIKTIEEMKAAAVSISGLGPANVLIKGGHSAEHPSTDVLYQKRTNHHIVLKNDVIVTLNNHGTGCTLSSAAAAYLAHGFELAKAVRTAKDYLSDALKAGAGYQIGNGRGPVHHFFEFWE
jgi:hydroxymethylpyrimidine/phosphomethylpyrimidine kinase